MIAHVIIIGFFIGALITTAFALVISVKELFRLNRYNRIISKIK